MSRKRCVYVVEGGSGHYDDYHKWVQAIFSSEESAKKYVAENNPKPKSRIRDPIYFTYEKHEVSS